MRLEQHLDSNSNLSSNNYADLSFANIMQSQDRSKERPAASASSFDLPAIRILEPSFGGNDVAAQSLQPPDLTDQPTATEQYISMGTSLNGLRTSAVSALNDGLEDGRYPERTITRLQDFFNYTFDRQWQSQDPDAVYQAMTLLQQANPGGTIHRETLADESRLIRYEVNGDYIACGFRISFDGTHIQAVNPENWRRVWANIR